MLLLIPLGVLFAHPVVSRPFFGALAKLTKGRVNLTPPSFGRMLGLLVTGTPTWLLVGGASCAITEALGYDQQPARIAFAAIVAWIVGFLAVPVPAGAGIRELIFVALCGLDAGPAVAVAAIARLMLMVTDGVGGVAGLLVARRAGDVRNDAAAPSEATAGTSADRRCGRCREHGVITGPAGADRRDRDPGRARRRRSLRRQHRRRPRRGRGGPVRGLPDPGRRGLRRARAGQSRVVPVAEELGSRPARLAWEQTTLPRLAKRLDVDVIHSPHYTMPLASPVPVAVTLHDATFFSDRGLHLGVKGRFFRAWSRTSLRRAAACIVPSAATADELVRYAHARRSLLTVAHHGVDPVRFHRPTDAEIAPSATISASATTRGSPFSARWSHGRTSRR